MKKEQKSIARSIYENIEAKKGRLNEDIKNSYENGYYVNIDGYNVYINAINIFDDVYETAYQYSQMGRSFNIGIRQSY